MRSTKSEKEKEEIFREYFSIYYDKGFEIYGVSLDSKKENWVKAIEDKKMKWPNVSDLKQWNCGPAQDYGVKGIPANFLIDSNGLIVSKDLHGDQLVMKLSELFK